MLWHGYISSRLYNTKVWFQDPQNMIWLTPLFGIVLACVLIILSWYLDTHVKIVTQFEINVDTLDSILSIIASSMLAVATFSLGIMVSAFSSVSNSITPRATVIVMRDQATQKAISSFLAAFLYAVIAKMALGQALFSTNGTYVLFIVTVLVLVYLVLTLIQWVKTLSTLGRLNDTVEKIESIANQQIKKFWEAPTFGLTTEPLTEHRYHILSSQIGYVTNINFKELNAYCEAKHIKFDIMVRHGDFIGYEDILCYTNHYIKNKDEILEHFTIEDNRRHEDNPNYGLIILSEIAQRALSPAVNDPGTSIYTLTMMSKILNQNKHIETPGTELKYKNLSIIPYDLDHFITPVFHPIAREGKEIIEVLVHLQKVLSSLSHNKNEALASLAKKYATVLMQNAQNGSMTKEEKQRLHQSHKSLFT